MSCLFPLVSPKTALGNLISRTIKHLLSLLLIVVASASAQRFPPETVFPSGGQPANIAIADVNGDGIEDLVISTFPDSNFNTLLEVLPGNGKGGFDAPKIIAKENTNSPIPTISSIVAADFNGDGRLDIAVSESAGQIVLVYLNTGGGNFSAPLASSLDGSSGGAASGDLNGDGKADLVVQTGLGAFSVLLGEGNGLFRAPVTIFPGADPLNSLTMADVNHDGHIDVAGASRANASQFGHWGARVYLGLGDGSFRPGGTCGDANSSGTVLMADFHGKGNLDLAVTLYDANPPGDAPGYVLVCPGNGDGTFANAVRYNAGYTPNLASADMNGDGNLDLVILDGSSDSVSVWLNRGNGIFASPAVKYATPPLPAGPFIGDFHHSGKPDVVVGTTVGVDVLANLGGGILHAPTSIVPFVLPQGDLLGALQTTDFDKDGHLDLAVAGFNDNQAPNVPLLFGNGKATFVEGFDPIGNSLGSIGPLAIGDFNGDGKRDLAAYLTSSETGLMYISIAYNNGTHTFSAGPTLSLPNQSASFVAGDFNRDGYSDFAVLDGNDVDIYVNQKNGSYRGPTSYHVGANPTFIYQRDLNGDGKPDLVVTNHDSNDVSILLGKGDGTFTAPASYPAGTHPNAVTTGDFDRDGKLDLAVGGDEVAILLGRGDGIFRAATTYPAQGPVSFLAQADLRGTGIEDLVCVGTARSFTSYAINVLYGKGEGSFIAPTGYGAGLFPSWLAVGDFNSDGASTWQYQPVKISRCC